MKILFSFLSTILLYGCNEGNMLNYEENLPISEEISINKDLDNNLNDEMTDTINLQIGENILTVKLENNSSTEAFVEKLKEDEIIINAKEYGNFEKIGDLGFSLPRNDENIKTQVGDIVLYQGNQISLFYNSNSWSYTKLGQIQDISAEKLKEILGEGDVELKFSL